MRLTQYDQELLDGALGEGTALAMRILVKTAELLGAEELLDVHSAHIDGCLYHGDGGVLFAEKLAANGAKTRIPTTLNVGALDLTHSGRERLAAEARSMAQRIATAYVSMGCKPTWTCAPYQAGHRPLTGQNVAWGESNAVVFCNSVLGARTNRYGDFLDICAAITGRAPRSGLHLDANRRATVLVDATSLPRQRLDEDVTYPVLGAWLGGEVGQEIAAFDGLGQPSEDRLKALGAAAASSGAVGLFHVLGVTPEAKNQEAAFGGVRPLRTIRLTETMLDTAQSALSTTHPAPGDPIDAVAIGSPHLSSTELRMLNEILGERRCAIPIYACTGRHALREVATEGLEARLTDRGVVVVADTCVVVTPILPAKHGILLTNSGKFAFYTPANTGYDVVYAGLNECVESAVAGRYRPRFYKTP
jgi:predicted aconitase